MKFKPQQCYKLIKTLLQTENEVKLGFELWPRFADFARFFCAFALKNHSMVITEQFFGVILKLFACGMFLRGFTVSSYQRPL